MLTETAVLSLTIIDILLFILAYVIISWLSSLIILGVDEHHLPWDLVLKYTLRCILLTPILAPLIYGHDILKFYEEAAARGPAGENNIKS